MAAGLFAQRGFHGVSVGDIGKAVGVSGPALYKHFDSKDAVLAEMLVAISERLLAEGQERVAHADGPDDALAALVDWHVTFALAQPAADRRPGPRLAVAAGRGARAGAEPPARVRRPVGRRSCSGRTRGSPSTGHGRWRTRRSG